MRNTRNLLIWISVITTLLLVYSITAGNPNGDGAQGERRKLTFTEYLSDVNAGNIATADIRGNTVSGEYTSGDPYSVLTPEYPGLVEELRAGNVNIQAKPQESAMGTVIGVLLSWFPIFLLIGVWIFLAKQMQGGKGGGAMGFGKSRARMIQPGAQNVTFDDVAGIDEAREELSEIVDYLKDPGKFQALGGKIPKGCLLVGSPGTGKTLMARAIAGEAGVPFFSISGSDFVEMFVGVGASRVRDLFEQGKKNAPCLIFIDEIDAVGRHRGAGVGGGNDEREQTLNQMLVEMDGFEGNEGVIILAATNRPDVLDPALLRPGRFDRQIMVPIPDIAGREKILSVHMQKVPLAPDVEPLVIARGTPGFTGADLANLVNEAALLAARRNLRVVTMAAFEHAKDKVLMGVERKSMVIDDNEKRLTAYHEAGHAIVGIRSPFSDPIHKATIIPRGRALGLVMRLPEKDRLSMTRGKAKADLAVAMGGRVAEEIIFGDEYVTSGASSDIKMATNLARAMVTEWGMSERAGPLHYSDSATDDPYAGMSGGASVSDETAQLLDDEIKTLVQEGYQEAKRLLTDHNKDLHTLAEALLEYETLSGSEIKDLLAGNSIRRSVTTPSPSDDTKGGGSVPTLSSADTKDAPPTSGTLDIKPS